MDVSDCLIPYVEDQLPQYRIRFITKPASAAIKELDFIFRKIGASTHRNEDELIVRERRLEHDALVRILASLAARYEKELQIAELPDAEKQRIPSPIFAIQLRRSHAVIWPVKQLK